MRKREQALAAIRESQSVTFLTGAGISVASGIPDYRSMGGVYEGVDQPEYLLSHSCLVREPQKFYHFVRQLYHPAAKPNVIHRKMAHLAEEKMVRIVTQNIDQLHEKAGSQPINFHGNLYESYCLTCGAAVETEAYLASDRHVTCGGQLRPNIVLYEENLASQVVEQAIQAVADAEVIVVVGTSFKVYPFAGLLAYKAPASQVVVVNNDALDLGEEHLMVTGDAVGFFEEL